MPFASQEEIDCLPAVTGRCCCCRKTLKMAGLGRRSHYRKHLTDATLNDFPLPSENECIAKVVATRGGNQFDVLVEGGGTPQLAILPSKFNKLIWVKRGDYCICETGDSSSDEDAEQDTGGVRYLITHILYKDQIKHIKNKGLWPTGPEFETSEGHRKQEGQEEQDNDEQEQDDGIVYDTGVDDEYFVNTNRVNVMQIEDSSESESSDDDDNVDQEASDGILYDTQDDVLFANTNRVAALRIEDSESESSDDEVDDDDIQRKPTSDSLIYDTGAMEKDAGPDTADIARAETSGSLQYDTGDAEEIADPSSHRGALDDDGTDDDREKGISRAETSESLLWDTGHAEEVADPSSRSHHGGINDDDSDDADDDSSALPQTLTSDSLVYDTGRDLQDELEQNGSKQASGHQFV